MWKSYSKLWRDSDVSKLKYNIGIQNPHRLREIECVNTCDSHAEHLFNVKVFVLLEIYCEITLYALLLIKLAENMRTAIACQFVPVISLLGYLHSRFCKFTKNVYFTTLPPPPPLK